MCGPSQQQKDLLSQQTTNAAQENSFMNQYFDQYKVNLAEQQGVLQQVQKQLQPILDKGMNQEGFNKAELANLNTMALNTTGANYANARRALNTAQAAGTNSGIMSGVAQQQQAALASAAAGQTSTEELGIRQADYAQGRQNYQTALGNLQNVAAMYNPQSYGGLQNSAGQNATASNQAAFNEATTINQLSNQWQADLVGGIMSGVGMVSGGLGNLDTTGGSSGGEQAKNFLGGMFCWIATKVFGESMNGFRTSLVRNWMLDNAPQWVLKLYRRHGKWASNQPIIVWALTPVFHWMLKQATKEVVHGYLNNPVCGSL